MKIISKYKDYYDFAAGHDTDPRKIYIRKAVHFTREQCPELSYSRVGSKYFLGEVWFCDHLFPYLHDYINGIFWYDYYTIPKSILAAINATPADRYSCAYYQNMSLEGHFDIELDKRNKRKHWWYSTHFRKTKINLNKKYETPVLYSVFQPHKWPDILLVKDGLLQDLKFAQVKKPAEAYTELYNWIPYHEPEMPSDPTDMGRFENKGFNKKTSFRGK